MIIVFNIFGVSRAELENSARISSVALICVCGLVACRSFHILRGLSRAMCIVSRHIIASSYANFFDCYKILCLILVLISI